MTAQKSRIVRIGCGAGFSGDRIDPAVELAERGALDYLVFECLAERTIALAQQSRSENAHLGYDPLLVERMTAVLPACAANGVKIVSNMGAANPVAAARRTAEIARSLGLSGLKIAAVEGDDVTTILRSAGAESLPARGDPIDWESVISANAYLGFGPILDALSLGADIVLTGRVADPSLFVGCLMHEFGWAEDDWTQLGKATLIGHLLECAGQLTGGYFADPGVKNVEALARLGFPLAEVAADGSAILTKLPGTGGLVSVATCKEQLLYEVQDPAAYITPDVVADFSGVSFRQIATDRVEVSGASGRARPETLKVSIGYRDGFIGEGQMSYAGSGALERAQLALQVVEERLRLTGVPLRESRYELIGLNSVSMAVPGDSVPPEVRIRAVGRTCTLEDALRIGREVESLYTNGPAGGGGASRSVKEVVAIASAFVPRQRVALRVGIEAV
jgi:Acyclic terpene utilisation family protein AtuA